MPVIDLTRYIVASAGTWTDPSQDDNLFDFAAADTLSPGRLLLRWAGDFVALTGPLRVRVTVQAENMTVPLALVGNLVPDMAASFEQAAGAATATKAGSMTSESALGRFGRGQALSLQASTIYSYTLDIAAGQAWPFSLSEQLAALRLQNARTARGEQLGNNLGYRVIIEPAFAIANLTPVTAACDLPCDFAVADQPNSASFFPSACEPCNGSVIGLPPSGAIALVIPPAEGGCVRTRFFNGMFITREDLETEQRYQRLKSRLHNRAAGAGVVWGLAVGRQGSQICVLPGYGVDCCGNDLALTTTYQVDIAALVADPACRGMAHQRGAHRMHLLLEYVECPAEPRPVHGDPCSPEASRCEMSRIRESVRLRLVPPRDYDAAKESAPITQFLNEVRALRERFPMAQGAGAQAAANAPFSLRMTATDRQDQPHAVTVRPSPQFDQAQFDPLRVGNLKSLEIEVILDPLWAFVGGTMSAEATSGGKALIGAVQPAGDASLGQGLGQGTMTATFDLKDNPDQLVFKLAQWEAQTVFAAEDANALGGELRFFVSLSDLSAKEARLDQSEIAPRPIKLAPAPCGGEPCAVTDRLGAYLADCAGTGIPGMTTPQGAMSGDPTAVLPWLHPDPMHPASAGDPKVLVLAALGGWLAQMLVRERAGTGAGAGGEVFTARRAIAQELYRAAWLLLFGLKGGVGSAVLGELIKRLFAAWCDGLLWKGPQCCGEPHGVVIGCAVVEGGTIRSIDPFGGRRHVVHYPLIEHWGAHFGVAPLDVTASRFFSTLCCLGALPAIGEQRAGMSTAVIPVGRGMLAVGEPLDVQVKLRERKIEVVSERTIGKLELIGSLLAAGGGSNTDGGVKYAALVLGEGVAPGTVMLLLPA